MKEAEKESDLETQLVENNNIELKANVKKLEKEVKDSTENIKRLQEKKKIEIKEMDIKNKTRRKIKKKTSEETQKSRKNWPNILNLSRT